MSFKSNLSILFFRNLWFLLYSTLFYLKFATVKVEIFQNLTKIYDGEHFEFLFVHYTAKVFNRHLGPLDCALTLIMFNIQTFRKVTNF